MTGAAAGASLQARLDRLEAVAEIGALMQRYADAADAKHTAAATRAPAAALAAAAAAQAACFTEDAEWSGGGFGGLLKGRAAIEAFFRNTPWRFTSHHYAPARIAPQGDRAEAEWRLLEIGLRDSDGHLLLLTGRVAQRLRRTGEGWRIAAMGFVQLHSVALAEAPAALSRLVPQSPEVTS